MKYPIAITEKEYNKGRAVFDSAADLYDWLVCDSSEDAVAKAVKTSGSCVAVLGVEKYAGPLYEALAANGAGRPTLISRHGVGYDGISLEQCRKHRVILSITKNAPDLSVAEHALALILALAKNIVFSDGEMRAGRFGPRRGFELAGKTLGIAGVGNIGKLAARMAAFGFGMNVVGFGSSAEHRLGEKEGLDPRAFKEKYGISAYFTDYASFAAVSDMVSVHMPAKAETARFFNEERLSLLKRGAWFINTSRGRLVDESALFDALSSGAVAGAALDVFDQEPYVPVSPQKDLRKLRSTVLTSHIGSDTEEAGRNMQLNILGNVAAYLSGSYDRLTAVYKPEA